MRSYARKIQYIFVAQCVWWLASIISPQQGWIIHIHNVRKRTEVGMEGGTMTSRLSTPIEQSENWRSSYCYRDLEMISQLIKNSDIGDSEPEKIHSIIKATNQVISQSINDWQAIESKQHPTKQIDPLCRTRQGKLLYWKLSKNERNSLNQISQVSRVQIWDLLWNRI